MERDSASRTDALAGRIDADLKRLLLKPAVAGLHIVATPIGNLGDITLRALVTLATADGIYCEDTRHSGTLLAHFGITTRMRPYHEHNAEAERPRILSRLEAGECIALISDAGTPLISDPGYKLVRDVTAAGLPVFALPGACAAIAALAIAGLPTDCFFFAGFLPSKSGQRQARLAELADVPATLIFYEAPGRLGDSLSDMHAVLGNRACVVARELTKLHEEITRGDLESVSARSRDLVVRGEIAIVVGPPPARDVSDADISAALAAEPAGTSTRDAVRNVTKRLGVARSRVYNLATLREQ